MKHTPESIIQVLHSIERVSVDDGELDTYFKDRAIDCAEGIRGFVPGSFTRELLELIEKHLLSGQKKSNLSKQIKAEFHHVGKINRR